MKCENRIDFGSSYWNFPIPGTKSNPELWKEVLKNFDVDATSYWIESNDAVIQARNPKNTEVVFNPAYFVKTLKDVHKVELKMKSYVTRKRII